MRRLLLIFGLIGSFVMVITVGGVVFAFIAMKSAENSLATASGVEDLDVQVEQTEYLVPADDRFTPTEE